MGGAPVQMTIGDDKPAAADGSERSSVGSAADASKTSQTGSSGLMVDGVAGSRGARAAQGGTKGTDALAFGATMVQVGEKVSEVGAEGVRHMGAGLSMGSVSASDPGWVAATTGSPVVAGMGAAAEVASQAVLPLQGLSMIENAARGRDAHRVQQRMQKAAQSSTGSTKDLFDGARREQRREVRRRGGRTFAAAAALGFGAGALATGGASLAVAAMVFGSIKGAETVLNLLRNRSLQKDREKGATAILEKVLGDAREPAVVELLHEMGLAVPEEVGDENYRKAHGVLKAKLGALKAKEEQPEKTESERDAEITWTPNPMFKNGAPTGKQ